jgi:protein ImuB
MAVSTRRILALWLPRLPTDRLTRRAKVARESSRGSQFDAPLIVSAKLGNALHVYALETRAARLGLYKGQPLANARAMVQPLAIVPADESADTALLDGIADWCDRFTPLVTLDSPDGLFLDITGAAHLFGGEAVMLALVVQKITEQGFAVRAAIAGTSLSARALARYAHTSVVPPGGEAAAVASLPIGALDCDAKTGRALHHAGLKTISQVAERLASELSERLGKAFVTRLMVMQGAAEQPLQPRRPMPDLMTEQHFAEPVVTQDAIAASLLSLAQSLGDILERQGRGVRVLEAAFFRADGNVERIAIKTGEAVRDSKVMLRLLRQKLDALADPLDAGFGFDLIRLEALLAEETRPGTISFDSDENARRQIAFLVDRLSVRFGEHRVQRFVPQDTHIPEAAGVAVPAQDRDFGTQNWTIKRRPGDPPRRPLRLLEKPEEIAAAMPVAPDGPPQSFRWRECLFEIAHVEGPERIAMEWWRTVKPTRDYIRIEATSGQRFWIYRDGLHVQNKLAPRWYLQGIFA